VIGQPGATQRGVLKVRDDDEALRAAIVTLVTRHGRYGYRRITALVRREGWQVNHKRVERIWGQEGLKVPQKHPKRGRLWLNDGFCVRLRPTHRNHVWSYDFLADRTHDGWAIKILTVIYEYPRQCLAIVVARKINSDEVLHCLTDLFVKHGPPEHIFAQTMGRNLLLRQLGAGLGGLELRPYSLSRAAPGRMDITNPSMES
jgi:transposase InsO family protein